jgi:hypothetical protein
MIIANDACAVTAIEVVPDFMLSWVDVAVIVAVPEAVGVNTPEDVIVPPVAVQVTAELYAPVPCTVAEQVDVWIVSMNAGEQTTETDVTVTGTVTVIVEEPDLVESSVDVAVTLAEPEAVGVNMPEDVIVPPVADQVTPAL